MKKSVFFAAVLFVSTVCFFITGCGSQKDFYDVGIIENTTDIDFQVYDIKFPKESYSVKATRSLRFPCYEDSIIKLKQAMDGIDIECGKQYLDECQLLATKFVIYEYKNYYHKVRVPEEFEVPINFEYEFKSVNLKPGDEYFYYSFFNDYKFYYHDETTDEDKEGSKTDLIVEDISYEEYEAESAKL